MMRFTQKRLLVLAAAVALGLPAAFELQAQAHAPPEAHADAVAIPSIRSNVPWMSMDAGGGLLEGRQRLLRGHFALSSAAGYRWEAIGGFLTLSYSRYSDPVGDRTNFHVGHLGAGIEKLWLQERVRSTFAAGGSILLSDTALDDRGSVGWFIEIRPSAFRWPLGDRWTVELNPLMFELSVPVASGMPLILANYATTIGLELRL